MSGLLLMVARDDALGVPCACSASKTTTSWNSAISLRILGYRAYANPPYTQTLVAPLRSPSAEAKERLRQRPDPKLTREKEPNKREAALASSRSRCAPGESDLLKTELCHVQPRTLSTVHASNQQHILNTGTHKLKPKS